MQNFQAENESLQMCLWSVFWEILGVPSPLQGNKCGPSQSYSHSNHEAACHDKETKEFPREGLLKPEVHPRLSVNHFGLCQLLKKGQSFEWGEVQQTAFQRLQQIMTNLPMVQAPIRKRPMLLYLAFSSYAIGALIAQENGSSVEQPVYYVSRTLKDAKIRYPKAERSCLVIVYASQRLRHYFLAYEIWLVTKSHAIKALLRQLILSRRMS